jgi:hypothetical protein
MRKEDDHEDDEDASPSSLISVHKLPTPDPLYDQQLLRDLEIVNDRTYRDLGPRLRRPSPEQPKRKPDLPRTPSNVSSLPVPDQAKAVAVNVGEAGEEDSGS